MIGERKEDIVLVAVDSKIEDMIIKYSRAHLGDRGEVGDGNVYSQEGRERDQDSERTRDNLRRVTGGEPGSEIDNSGDFA